MLIYAHELISARALISLAQSENFGSIRESSLGCMSGVELCMKKLHFISRNRSQENRTVASGSSPIKVHYFDYLKRFINVINEVYDFQ